MKDVSLQRRYRDINCFYIPPQASGGVLWYNVGCWCVFPSIRPSVVYSSVFSLSDDNLKKCQLIFTKHGIYTLILWRFGLVLLTGKFRQFLTDLIARDTSIFTFVDDKFSKYEWIFTKLGMCIDITELSFEINNGKFYQFLTIICPRHVRVFISRQ